MKLLYPVASLLFTLAAYGQGTPDIQFQSTFSAQAPGNAQSNKGASAVAFRFTYYTALATGVSVRLEGTNDIAGLPNPGGWTALTPAPGSTSPALGTANGEAAYCCDYYPWIRVNPTTLTGTPGFNLIGRTYGFKGTSAGSVPPGSVFGGPFTPGNVVIGAGGQGISGSTTPLSSLVVNPMTNLGDMISGGAAGAPARVAGNITTSPLCLIQTGTGAASSPPVWSPCPANGQLTYYFQNSILASGTYSSGGTTTGTVGQTCTLTTFNGGGSGATATVALTGLNVIAGGTAILVTAPGSRYTSIPTTATLGNGTAACSGTATLVTVLNVPPSNVSGDFRAISQPYLPTSTMVFTQTLGTGTQNVQDFITDPGIPNLTFIPQGEYGCHIHASRSNGFTGTVLLQCAFVEVTAGGVDIAVIGTSEPSPNITLTSAEYALTFASSAPYIMQSAASRIVARLQNVHTSIGVAGTITVGVGNQQDSHFSLPSNTVDSTNFVPYVGATADVNLGAHRLIMSPVLNGSGFDSGLNITNTASVTDPTTYPFIIGANILLTNTSTNNPNTVVPYGLNFSVAQIGGLAAGSGAPITGIAGHVAVGDHLGAITTTWDDIIGATFTAEATGALTTVDRVIGLNVSTNANHHGATANTAYGVLIADITGASTNRAIKTGLGIVEFGDIVKAVGSLQLVPLAADPGCAAAGDYGKFWFDNTGASTIRKTCNSVVGVPTWVAF